MKKLRIDCFRSYLILCADGCSELLTEHVGKYNGTYDIEECEEQKKRLDAAKKLQDNIPQKEFNRLRYLTNLYAPLRGILSQRGIPMVTNAWLKMCELTNFYNLLSLSSGVVGASRPQHPTTATRTIFFNAEFPGAFIAYMLSVVGPFGPNNTQHIRWFASSLLPGSKEEEILGDVYSLYRKYRDHWLMGDDNDGDVTKIENVLDFEKKISLRTEGVGVDLYTSDLGKDIGNEYGDQEILHLREHLGAAVCAFVTLREGGNMVLKQYTLFHCFSVSLAVLYSSMFDEFYIGKPLTSSPANSEVYLVGLGFRGMSADVRRVLFERLEHFNTSPILLKDQLQKSVCGGAYKDIINAEKSLAEEQIKFLEERVRIYKDPPPHQFRKEKEEAITLWLKRNKL